MKTEHAFCFLSGYSISTVHVFYTPHKSCLQHTCAVDNSCQQHMCSVLLVGFLGDVCALVALAKAVIRIVNSLGGYLYLRLSIWIGLKSN